MKVVAATDVLRQGGIDVKLLPDLHIDDVQGQQFDAIIVLGGSKGTEQLASCKKADTILVDHHKANKLFAIICPDPISLSTHFYHANQNTRSHDITCYPTVVNLCKNKFKSIKLEPRVVDSQLNNRHLMISHGPATAMEFAIKILSHLTDKKKTEEIHQQLLA